MTTKSSLILGLLYLLIGAAVLAALYGFGMFLYYIFYLVILRQLPPQ